MSETTDSRDEVVQAWVATDVGRKRRHNEDSYLVDSSLGLYVVADGMGGHAAGETASSECVSHVRLSLLDHEEELRQFARSPSHELQDRLQKLMVASIQRACLVIYEMAREDESRRGMGTTCVALLVCGRKAIIGHVGDSRIYLARRGHVHQLTEDHSLVEEHVKRGLMTREQAEKSDIRNVITRAVGLQPSVEVDTLVTDVEPGDLFLLCSDGLHGYFGESEDLAALLAGPRAKLPGKLTALANERGGKDNITALVVSAGPDETPGDASAEVSAKVELLRRIPLFQYMNYKELLSLLAIAKGRHYAAGERIITEGESGAELFVLFRGQVEVSKNGSPITRLGAGGHFGEMGLVDDAPRSATIDAVDPTNLIAFERDALLVLMKKNSLLAVKLLWSFSQVLSDRLRSTSDQLSGLHVEVERLRSGQGSDEARPSVPFGDAS